MARVLTCIDAAPAQDGTCTTAVYLEQPLLIPAMTLEQGREIGHAFLLGIISVVAIKVFLGPKLHRKS